MQVPELLSQTSPVRVQSVHWVFFRPHLVLLVVK